MLDRHRSQTAGGRTRPLRLISLLVVAATSIVLAVAPATASGRYWMALRSSWSPGLVSSRGSGVAAFASARPGLHVAGVGSGPVFAAENYKTHTLYVTNSNDNTVSALNRAACSAQHLAGCRKHAPVVHVGHLPLGLAVDQATDTVYVSDAVDGKVSVINGATCNASDSSGCSQKPATVAVGAFGDAVAVDPVTNTVFVTNQAARPGTVSVIDGNSCNGTHRSGCASQPFATVTVGGGPSGIDFSPRTNTIYVARHRPGSQ